MTIGSLELIPAFDPDEKEYTTSTSNATNKITATTTDPSAVIVIEVGEGEDAEVVENEGPATWASGANVVTITVTDGEDETVYTITVTAILE